MSRSLIYGVAIWLLVVILSLTWLVARGDGAGVTMEIPSGTVPAIDGSLSEGEWDDAAILSAENGLSIYAKHQGTVLYIGMRSARPAVANVLVAFPDETRILHSSAALGTATYIRDGDTWRLRRDFVWACRDPGGSASARAERSQFRESQGWIASTTFMGTPGETEYEMDWDETAIAVSILVAPTSDPGAVVSWPAGAGQNALPGPIPSIAEFDSSTWGAIALLPPAWEDSPGGWIAFSGTRDGNADIYVLSVRDGSLERVTTGAAEDSEPAWSPDGGRLAFQSRRPSWSLFTVLVDGSEERALAPALSWSPSWSPDGSVVAYSTGSAIRAVSVDGGEARTLVPVCGDCGHPSWSPDGTKLAFHSDQAGSMDIYVVDVASGETHRLTYEPGRDFLAAWSPDGSRFAFASDRMGNLEIFTMRADGTEVTRVTDDRATDMLPAWSPSGEWLAFVSERDGNAEIYIVRPDGTGLRRLTDHPGADMYPAWRPGATEP